MKTEHTIEYSIVDGIILFGGSSVDEIEVEFESYPEWTDNSFDHEFGTQKYDPYVILENFPTWNKRNFTEQENKIIQLYLEDNNCYSELEDIITSQYSKIDPNEY